MFKISQTQMPSYPSKQTSTSNSNVGSTQQFQGSMLEYGRVPRSSPPSSK